MRVGDGVRRSRLEALLANVPRQQPSCCKACGALTDTDKPQILYPTNLGKCTWLSASQAAFPAADMRYSAADSHLSALTPRV